MRDPALGVGGNLLIQTSHPSKETGEAVKPSPNSWNFLRTELVRGAGHPTTQLGVLQPGRDLFMPRLFAGIEIPASLQELLVRLAFPLPGARWVERGDFHLTLRFYGDINNHQAAELADRLGSIDLPVFTLRLKGLGAFGGREPRTLWAGADTNPEMDTLVRACERAARRCGLPPDTAHPFRPHVTLARLRHTPAEDVARFLERRGGFRAEPFTVERFVLFSSRPGTGGGPYVVEEAYPLAGSSPYDWPAAEGSW